MTPALHDDLTCALRTLPRDGVLVTSVPSTWSAARGMGRRALLHGQDFADYHDLRDRWSRLTRRTYAAHVIGPEWLADAVQHFCEVTAINAESSRRRCRRWAEHILRNVPRLCETPHAMVPGAFAGVPCYVIGAGPSLDRNRHRIPADGIRLAVNSASLAVEADAVLCIESNDISRKLDERPVQLLGVACPPALIEDRQARWRGVWTGELAWVVEQLTGIPRIFTSGSVTTAAVSLAHLWGCDPIVLVGQDLAFPGGQVYASATGFRDTIRDDGVYEWRQSAQMARPNNPLPQQDELTDEMAWGGQGTVKSSVLHRGVRAFLGAFAEAYGDSVTLINATEGGSRIDGWREQPLEMVPKRGTWFGPSMLERLRPATLDRSMVTEWLDHDAPGQLAQVWAYTELSDYLTSFRSKPPHRIPWREARAVRGAQADLRAIVARAEDDVRSYVRDWC